MSGLSGAHREYEHSSFSAGEYVHTARRDERNEQEKKPFPHIIIICVVLHLCLFNGSKSKTLSVWAISESNGEWVINASLRTVFIRPQRILPPTANSISTRQRRWRLLMPFNFIPFCAASSGCAKIIYTTLLLRHIKIHRTPITFRAHPRNSIYMPLLHTYCSQFSQR